MWIKWVKQVIKIEKRYKDYYSPKPPTNFTFILWYITNKMTRRY